MEGLLGSSHRIVYPTIRKSKATDEDAVHNFMLEYLEVVNT